MSQNTEDLRIRRTKESIRNALKQMVMEMPFEKITVKELAVRAMINRNTFYLHYESTDSVLREIQREYSEKYIALISGLNIIENQAELVRHFFEYMESQDGFFIHITCDARFDYIREYMQQKVVKKSRINAHKTKNEYVQNILKSFCNTPLYLYRQWVEDGRKIPMKEMIKLATLLMEKGISGFRQSSEFQIISPKT